MHPRRAEHRLPTRCAARRPPVRIASLKALASQPVKVGRVPETDFESYPARQPGSSTRDTVVQRTAKHDMPSPILSFDGISNLCGCYPPDTEGDVGPNHYMQWVNLHYAIYTKTGTRSCRRRPGTRSSRARSFCGSHNNGDPIVLYDQFAGRWMVSQFAFNSTTPGAVLPVHRGLEHRRPDGGLVRLRVPRPPDEVQRLPEVRHLAGAELVHDDRAAVQLRAAARASGASSATRCSTARRRASSTRTWSRSTRACRGSSRRTPTARRRRPTARLSRSSPTTTTAPASRPTRSMSGTRR